MEPLSLYKENQINPRKLPQNLSSKILGSFMVHQSVQCSLLNCSRDVLRSFSHSSLRCFTASCSFPFVRKHLQERERLKTWPTVIAHYALGPLSKRENRHFHNVVVQGRQKKNTHTHTHKKKLARAGLLFCQSKPIAFLPSSLTSRRLCLSSLIWTHGCYKEDKKNWMRNCSRKQDGVAFLTAL